MKKKVINSKADGVTADMQKPEKAEREFRFPKLGLTIKAVSLSEALKKAKKINEK